MNVEDEISRKGWEQAYEHATPIAGRLWEKEPITLLGDALAYFSSLEATRILDAGCGDGRNLNVLLEKGYVATGADFSMSALDMCLKRLLNERRAIVSLVHARLDKLPFPDYLYDGILCVDVLGHVKNIKEVLLEIYRVLTPGGGIFGTVFTAKDGSLGTGRMLNKSEMMYEVNYPEGQAKFYYRYYKKEEVKNLFSDCGFEVEDIYSKSWEEPPHEVFRPVPHLHDSWLIKARKPE